MTAAGTTTGGDAAKPPSLGDVASAATFAVAVITAWLYAAGWSYAYHYLDRFRVPLLMADLPLELYLVYPLIAEEQTLGIMRGIVATAGLAIIVLSAAIAWIVARGNRRLRYIGTIKNNAWLHTRAAALNLRTLINLGLTRTGNAWTLKPSLT